MRCEYLKEFKHGYYMELLLGGKLNKYLHGVDEECHGLLDRLCGANEGKARCNGAVEGGKSDALGGEDE